MKVIAFTCCAITCILLLSALGTSDWVEADGWREGLFTQCIGENAPTPLPFGADPEPGCRRAHGAGYVRGAAALTIIAFLTDFFGTTLTCLGLRSTDPNKKYKYYRVAIYALGIASIALFLAVVIYPTSFAKDMENDEDDNDDDGDGVPDALDNDDDNDGIPDHLDLSGKKRDWGFGFGFGASCFSLVFLVLSLVLLICDRESEEIFYKEREAEEEEGEEEKEEA